MKKYNDSDELYIIQQGYNESTRCLSFHSLPIEYDRLQEALDIIQSYNEFDSINVGEAFEQFGDNYEYIIGRENSVCVYVIPKINIDWDEKDIQILKYKTNADEAFITRENRLRLWWD